MLTVQRELAYLRAAVPLLKIYLQSSEPGMVLTEIAGDGGHPYSLLTLGPLLFILKRLKARRLTGETQDELGRYEEQIFQEKIHNESVWKKKAGQDLGSRIRMWQRTLDELNTDSMAITTSYPTAVDQRVIMQLLWEEIEMGGLLVAPLKFTLEYSDEMLRLFFHTGDFIWEEELKPAFPEETYWYLYGRVIGKERSK
jgi:hypothetical protein